MRGDYCHNQILIGRLQQVASECGAAVSVEYPVRVGGQTHYIDLLVTHQDWRLACEPAQCPARIGNDVLKAKAVGAGVLLIPTPDAPTAQACRRKLRRLHLPKSDLQIIICPLGAALEILRTLLTQPMDHHVNERKSI